MACLTRLPHPASPRQQLRQHWVGTQAVQLAGRQAQLHKEALWVGRASGTDDGDVAQARRGELPVIQRRADAEIGGLRGK